MKQTYVLVSGVSALVGATICAVVVIWFIKPESTTQELQTPSARPPTEKFVARITPDAEPVSRAPASKGAFENVRTLADTLAFETDFDQTIAIHLLLANADEAFVLDLLRQAETISPPSQKEAAFSIIFSKYAALDPARALAKAEGLPLRLRQRVLMNIFHEWSRNDLESAIEAAESLEDMQRQAAGYVILSSRDDLAPGRRAEIAEQFNQQRQLAMLNRQVWIDKVSEDPRSVWQQTLNSSDADLNTLQFKSMIGHQWIREEGIVVLDEMVSSLPDSFNKRQFLFNLMPSLVDVDPQGALDFISRFPNAEDVRHLRQTFFSSWSSLNPRAAAESLQKTDFHQKGYVKEAVLGQWARKDPRELLEASDTMPQSWIDVAKRHALTRLARSSRQEAISYLGDISDSHQRHQVEDTLAREWSEEDLSAALKWYLSLDRENDDEQRHQSRVMMMNAADRDPTSALQLAAEYSGVLGSAMVGGVFNTLVRAGPQQARQYLPRVNQKQKRVAVGEIGFVLAREDLMGAFQLGDILDKSERLEYGKDLIERSLHWNGNRDVLLSNFNDLPSREIKVHGAVLLINQDEYEKFLSSDERQRLLAVLNATERSKLETDLQRMRELIDSMER